MKKIYDCFCFFNELDILELRLNILDPYVDYFVISEASVTHTGIPKPYYFEENKKRYSKFLHKIIHLKVEDTPDDFINLPSIQNINSFDGDCVSKIHKFIEIQTKRFNKITQIPFGRDFYQKECVRRGLTNCSDNDIILFSDCDEIPNPEILKNIDNIIDKTRFFMFNQMTYYYYLNVLRKTDWKGTRMSKYINLKDYSFNEFRYNPWYNIDNGGWHFSFMGGEQKVKIKIQSCSAQYMNNSRVIDSIPNNMENNIDPFFNYQLTKVEIDNTYPKYLLDNLDSYKHMIKE